MKGFGYFLLLCTFSLLSILHVDGYCAIKNRRVHKEISRAIIQGSHWLLNKQEQNGKWFDIHSTGNVIATLKMIGFDQDNETFCTQTFTKAAEYFAASKAVINKTHGGKLAYIIMGLHVMCMNPSNYMGMNLASRLLEDLENFPKGGFNHLFQYSLGLIALGVTGEIVPWKVVELVVNRIGEASKPLEMYGKDTSAMMLMALAAVNDQDYKPRRTKIIRKTMKRLVTYLGKGLEIGTDNLHTKSLIMQAFSAANKVLPIHHKKCERLHSSILREKSQDGSFGGLSGNLHALPAFSGVSYLDLKTDSKCSLQKGREKKTNISVCVRVEFHGFQRRNPPQQYIIVKNGTTAIEVFHAASLSDPCFEVIAKRSSWGLSVRSVCQYEINHPKMYYWMFYVNNQMSMTGVGEYIPKMNECLTLKYQSVDFRK